MKTCDVCGKEFWGSRKEQVTCSPACRTKKWKEKHEAHKQYYSPACRECGKEFKTTDPRKTFCSQPCRTMYRNKQRPTTQLLERACVVCGTMFKPLQKRGVGRKWCSEECRLTILRGYKPRKRQKELDRKKKAALATRLSVARRGGHKVIDLKRTYGITVEQYEQMLKNQNGVCAICKKDETVVDKKTGKVRMLAVDHHHVSGEVRRLLCTRCNQGLGNFLENPEIIKAAIVYLEQHNG